MAKRQNIFRTDFRGNRGSLASNQRYPYEYPNKLKLKPGTPLHDKLVDEVFSRATIAKEKMADRYEAWDKTDETLQAYIHTSEAEKLLKEKKPNSPISIVVPYSYAALETILTYLVMAFINQRPIIQYESVSAEDEVANKLLEVIVDRQMEYYKSALALYVFMRDGLAYGIGGCAPIWRTDLRPVKSRRPVMVDSLAGPTQELQETSSPQVVFEGTELLSIGPRYLLMDPNSSPHKIQNSEFVGWIEETNIHRLLTLEKNQPGTWFNARYVKDAGLLSSVFAVSEEYSSASRGRTSISTGDSNPLHPVVVVHMYVDLIPADWELPPGADNPNGIYPEKWFLTIANDWYLLRAERLESSHGKFPMAINAPDFDGYTTYPMARLEVSQGLQDSLNWLFNSHISNVRKVVNNTLVVDPSLVNLKDIEDAREGGIIRLAQSAWGKNIKDAVYQLQVNDVTRGNIGDAEVVISLMQRILASTDNMMGIARQGGERVSATESRNVALAANSRVEKIARLISIQGLQDLGYFMATNTQDYMSQDVKLKVLGSWPQELIREYGQGKSLIVSPDQLAIPFDTIVRDGSLMVDTSGVANVWLQLFQAIITNQTLAPQFDITRIFMHIARLLGAKNLNDFIATQGPNPLVPAVVPDETAAKEANKGNLVPVGQITA